MNQRIIYTDDAGGVSIVIPAPECGLTVEEIAAKDCPPGAAFEIVDVSAVPTDRTFRAAWEKHGSEIGHNIVKCKAISHDKRRAARAAEFAPLDIEATIPAKAAQAEAKRQLIREKYDAMQVSIDAATTADALKAIVVTL